MRVNQNWSCIRTWHIDCLFRKSRSDPRKINFVEFTFPFVRELRLFASELEGVLAPLLHDPSTKGLVRGIRLGHVAIAVFTFVLHELLETLVPADGGFRDAPLKANGFQFFNALLGETRLWFLAVGCRAGFLEVGFVLVFALHLDPLESEKDMVRS